MGAFARPSKRQIDACPAAVPGGGCLPGATLRQVTPLRRRSISGQSGRVRVGPRRVAAAVVVACLNSACGSSGATGSAQISSAVTGGTSEPNTAMTDRCLSVGRSLGIPIVELGLMTEGIIPFGTNSPGISCEFLVDNGSPVDIFIPDSGPVLRMENGTVVGPFNSTS